VKNIRGRKDMNFAFENLDKIIDILEKLDSLNSKILNIENRLAPKLDLTKRDGVKKYLDISDSTLYQMMNDGRLKQNIHYKKTINGKRVNIIFVESAIVGFKEKQK
jgi:predicted DNA-binding transcriptional regulator AlpA